MDKIGDLVGETNNQIFLCVDLICPFAETEISEFNRFADEISDFIQSEPTISQIADHRSLIGAYRSDVKFLRLLDKLTARICTA